MNQNRILLTALSVDTWHHLIVEISSIFSGRRTNIISVGLHFVDFVQRMYIKQHISGTVFQKNLKYFFLNFCPSSQFTALRASGLCRGPRLTFTSEKAKHRLKI